MALSRPTESGIVAHACGLLTSSVPKSPRVLGPAPGPWAMTGEILNGDVTYPGPVQVLVYVPGLGSPERHDFGLVGLGAGGYSTVES